MRVDPFVLEQTELLREQAKTLCNASSELRRLSQTVMAESREAQARSSAIRAAARRLTRDRQYA
jgi:hypothetical protein